MHIVLIAGSHRPNSETGRVADYLAAQLVKNHGATTDVLKLEGNPVPLWDQSAWDPSSDLSKLWAPYAARLAKADGFVVLTPEWAGMAAPGLKNFMVYTHESNVGHKPALLVSVSAGMGGSYPIDELRGSSYKNNKIAYLPEHLIVRHVGAMLKTDAPEGKDDEFIRGRIDFALNVLMAYTAAMKPMRDAGGLTDARYPFGM